MPNPCFSPTRPNLVKHRTEAFQCGHQLLRDVRLIERFYLHVKTGGCQDDKVTRPKTHHRHVALGRRRSNAKTLDRCMDLIIIRQGDACLASVGKGGHGVEIAPMDSFAKFVWSRGHHSCVNVKGGFDFNQRSSAKVTVTRNIEGFMMSGDPPGRGPSRHKTPSGDPAM